MGQFAIFFALLILLIRLECLNIYYFLLFILLYFLFRLFFRKLDSILSRINVGNQPEWVDAVFRFLILIVLVPLNTIKAIIEFAYERAAKSKPLLVSGLTAIYIWMFWCFALPIVIDSGLILEQIPWLPLSSDKMIKEALGMLAKTLSVIAPLSVTFYYFTYREQKAISESAASRQGSNVILLFFIITISFAIVDLGYLSLIWPDYASINYTMDHPNYLITALLLMFFSLLCGGCMINTLINGINIESLLEKNIAEARRLTFILSFVTDVNWAKDIRKYIYHRLQRVTESVYQMLIQTVEKNMSEVFYSNYEEWEVALTSVYDENRLLHLFADERYLYFLRVDPSDYIQLYKSILKSHLYLIICLYDNQRMQEASHSLNKFFYLSPQGHKMEGTSNDIFDTNYNRLITEYFTALYELTIYIYNNESVGLQPIFDNIKEMAEKYAPWEEIIIFYKALILKAVECNDVKLLSSLSHSLIQTIKQNANPIKSGKSVAVSKIIQASRRECGQQSRVGQVVSEAESTEERRQVGKCLYVLLQAALKGVELSHYATVGFLIKYLISYFRSDVFNIVYTNFLEKGAVYDPVLEEKELYDRIIISFKFNKHTAPYCIAKLTVLVYGQQKYIRDHDIKVRHIPDNYIDIANLREINYLEYIFDKLDKAKEKYGLLFLGNERFIASIKQDVIPKIAGKKAKYNVVTGELEEIRS